MLACLASILLALIVYGTYATLSEPATRRGEAGPLPPDAIHSKADPGS